MAVFFARRGRCLTAVLIVILLKLVKFTVIVNDTGGSDGGVHLCHL